MQKAPARPVSRLAWATDLHLDVDVDAEEVGAEFAKSGADALVITGDIAVSNMLAGCLDTLVDTVGVPIFFVLGNHDYYGSTFRETDQVADRVQRPGLTWLRKAGVVKLSPTTALVGTDGLYDFGYGTGPEDVWLRDFGRIRDFDGADILQRRHVMQRRGKRLAARVEPALHRACETHERVIFATHVPPFPDAAGWRNEPFIPDRYQPFYADRSMGDMLLSVAAAHRETQILVLAGHTHGAGRAAIAPNLVARTGGATYGAPEIVDILDVSSAAGKAA